MRVTLTVTAGPHKGQVFTFAGHETFIVGRSKRAHFRLPVKDKYFSRIHFMVEVNPPQCRLMDMGSTNGTHVNGARVPMADLKDGDQIRAGRTILRVSVEGVDSGVEAPTLAPAPAAVPEAPSPVVTRADSRAPAEALAPASVPPEDIPVLELASVQVSQPPAPPAPPVPPAAPAPPPPAAPPIVPAVTTHVSSATGTGVAPPAPPSRPSSAPSRPTPTPPSAAPPSKEVRRTPPPARPTPTPPPAPRPVPTPPPAAPGPTTPAVAVPCPACGTPIAAAARAVSPLCYACQEQARQLPQPIAGYQVVRELGRGGMGVVYLALRQADGSAVALKTIIPAVAGSQSQVERFLREANILRELDHPHIVAFRDLGESGGQLFFAMDYVRGTDASKLVKTHGPLAVARAAGLVCQLLEALEYAHGKGFVHRDIKPANLLVAERAGGEAVKLADFGLARVYQTSQMSGLTMTGDVGGTTAYMAPEQITHYREAKPPVDQYAAAATLYNLLTGKFIFDPPRNFQQQLLMVLQDEPVPIQTRRADVPDGLAAVIHRALAKKPEDRFPSVQALRQALAKFAP